jgi:hypothetical protein
MSRDPLPHRALGEAILSAKARGIVQLWHSGAGTDIRYPDHLKDPGHLRPGNVFA